MADTEVARSLHPQPISVVVPPIGFPTQMAGHRVIAHLLVDARGRVVRDSIEPTGWRRLSMYASDFEDGLHQYRFRPAVLNGCAVPSWATFRFDF